MINAPTTLGELDERFAVDIFAVLLQWDGLTMLANHSERTFRERVEWASKRLVYPLNFIQAFYRNFDEGRYVEKMYGWPFVYPVPEEMEHEGQLALYRLRQDNLPGIGDIVAKLVATHLYIHNALMQGLRGTDSPLAQATIEVEHAPERLTNTEKYEK